MDAQKKEGAGNSAILLDKAITDPQQDRFGYRHIAQQLALAVEGIGREGSAVVGIVSANDIRQ